MMRIFKIFCCEGNKYYSSRTRQSRGLKPQKWFFTGFQLNPDGVSPVPTMLEAILSMPNAEFLCKVLSKLCDVVKALRELINKDVPIQRTDSHDKAFVESKKLIAQGPVM